MIRRTQPLARLPLALLLLLGSFAVAATLCAQTASAPVEAMPATATPAAVTPATPQSKPEAAPVEQSSTPEQAPAGQMEKNASAVPSGGSAKNALAADSQGGGITEDQLKQMLLNKALYLRGGYLESNLNFNEHGALVGHATQGSYTLSGIEVTRIRLTKHKVELDAVRYGLHFLGAMPYEDPTTAVDRVRITPAKKAMRITIDREVVVKAKKVKAKKENKKAKAVPASATRQTAQTTMPPVDQAKEAEDDDKDDTPSPAEQLKASIAATPEAEKPADPKSVTTTTSPAHSAQVLKDALDKIFAPGLDERMMATMPEFWKLYYQAVAAKSDYRPKDPAVLRQSMVDKKAKLITNFEPGSNEFAQNAGVAGMALYHTVIGPDGVPGEVAVARPIGFGLDENAVSAIAKARFEPATKNGQPVPVLVDLVVQFRIFSGRTGISNSSSP